MVFTNLYMMRLCLLILGFCTTLGSFSQQKIGGIHLESPQKRMYADYVKPVSRIGANWMAIVPFAFMNGSAPTIEYNCSKNWWGSTPQGISNTVKYCQFHEIKTILKPHFWVEGVGWAGELEFTEKDWKKWEMNYEQFILKMAHLADSLKMDMFCIGVELKTAVQQRKEFWKQLIPKIRKQFSGRLTYAANWDNYTNIPFWEELDYIGVDAYFPLSNAQVPTLDELTAKWEKHRKELKVFSKQKGKQILFTEMGYRSILNGAGRQWEQENTSNQTNVNLHVQMNAFESLFQTFWKELWFAGGFIWEWHPDDKHAGGQNHSNYTPQHKPAEKIIRKWYELYN